jgi:hypothetical protein
VFLLFLENPIRGTALGVNQIKDDSPGDYRKIRLPGRNSTSKRSSFEYSNVNEIISTLNANQSVLVPASTITEIAGTAVSSTRPTPNFWTKRRPLFRNRSIKGLNDILLGSLIRGDQHIGLGEVEEKETVVQVDVGDFNVNSWAVFFGAEF